MLIVKELTTVCLWRTPKHSRKSYSDRQLRRIASVSFIVCPRLPVRSGIAASIGLPPYIGCATEKLQADHIIHAAYRLTLGELASDALGSDDDLHVGAKPHAVCWLCSDPTTLLIFLKPRRRHNRYK